MNTRKAEAAVCSLFAEINVATNSDVKIDTYTWLLVVRTPFCHPEALHSFGSDVLFRSTICSRRCVSPAEHHVLIQTRAESLTVPDTDQTMHCPDFIVAFIQYGGGLGSGPFGGGPNDLGT